MTPENSTFSKLGGRYNSKIPTTYKRLPKGVEKRKKVKRNEESTGPQQHQNLEIPSKNTVVADEHRAERKNLTSETTWRASAQRSREGREKGTSVL